MSEAQEVMLSITGIQDIGGDKDKIELITNGTLQKEGNEYIIDYEETIETGMEDTHTRINASSEKVVITRSGARSSQLLLEKGMRHLNHYDTGYGQVIMGISTSKIDNTIALNGELSVAYSIEMNHTLASKNSFFLKIKEVKNNGSKSSVCN